MKVIMGGRAEGGRERNKHLGMKHKEKGKI